MTRIPRIHISGALFYVTSRGDNKNNIFSEPADYKFYLELLKKYKEQYGFKLFAFCLLPNHLHLLIELKPGLTISEVMHDLNSNYTKYFNSKYNRKGHLFQERYKLVLLQKEAYLLPLTIYIHLNPVILGLVKDVLQYEYSSYGDYIGKKTQFTLEINEEIMEISKYCLDAGYEIYLKNAAKVEIEALGSRLRKEPILGSGEFIDRIKQEALNISKQTQCDPAEIKKLHSTNRKFVFAGSAIIIVLSLFTVYFYAKILGLKDSFNKELQQKDTQLSEEYRSQMDSYYKEMSKTLQVERQKAKYLEEKLRGD